MKLVILAALALAIILAGCQTEQKPPEYSQFTFEWSDGSCSSNSDCQAFEYGCGGGHIMCTNDTAKWKGMMSTCDIVENHPSQQGFRCACVLKDKKCGWVK